jgi:polysaccharide biosynthesis/export protein
MVLKYSSISRRMSEAIAVLLASATVFLSPHLLSGQGPLPSGSQQNTVPFQSGRWPKQVGNPVPAMAAYGEPGENHPQETTGGPGAFTESSGNSSYQEMAPKSCQGVDEGSCARTDGEPTWRDTRCIPWESYAWGEYIGPHRTPAVPQYRVRVNDRLEFVFLLTREQSLTPYRLTVGDTIEVTSTADEELNQKEIKILSDGSISLRLIGRVMAARKTIEELQQELNQLYDPYFEVDPAIVVRGTSTDIRLQDLLNAVDSRFNNGGTSKLATVSPDGTIQLPLVGSIPAIGLTLDELRREVNMHYRKYLPGFEVTPILAERAPTFVYVLGEVRQPGRVQLTGPTSAMQAVALAGGWNAGGNLRQIVVFRRDENWRLMALRLDLAGGLHGMRPMPSDEIWLRDSDIVLVPKMPIQRIADAVDLYFTRTIYGIFPSQFQVDGLSSVNNNP